ncbi:MAG: hypothetical protein JWO88_3757 [Frankiales bacterium]|nr:hypothetical protein [Frankiales bacterium]
MTVYLAKLAQQLVRAVLASLKVRSRFFGALVASASVGFVWSYKATQAWELRLYERA